MNDKLYDVLGREIDPYEVAVRIVKFCDDHPDPDRYLSPSAYYETVCRGYLKLHEAIEKMINELGVPNGDYPQPVANAVQIGWLVLGKGEKFLSSATLLDGGICKCDTCNEILLEDERHWHWRRVEQTVPSSALGGDVIDAMAEEEGVDA